MNFAVDRPAMLRAAGRATADQFVQPGIPGFRDAAIYPLERPDVLKGEASLMGHIRGRTAVLYRSTVPSERARAQVLVSNLNRSGSRSTSRRSAPGVLRAARQSQGRVRHRAWTRMPDYIDPYQYTNLFFDGRHHRRAAALRALRLPDATTRLMRRAASLQGKRGTRPMADLDVQALPRRRTVACHRVLE